MKSYPIRGYVKYMYKCRFNGIPYKDDRVSLYRWLDKVKSSIPNISNNVRENFSKSQEISEN